MCTCVWLLHRCNRYIVSTESGNVLIWNVRAEAVVFKTEQKNVQQLLLLDDDTKFVTVSKVLYAGGAGRGWDCCCWYQWWWWWFPYTCSRIPCHSSQPWFPSWQVALDTGELSCYVATRSIPTGALVYELDYPMRSFRQIAVTADGLFLVIPTIEGIKVRVIIVGSIFPFFLSLVIRTC